MVVIQSQQGMSVFRMLVVIMLLISSVFLAIKLAPLYMNDYVIGKTLVLLEQEADFSTKSKSQIHNLVQRKLAADYTTRLADEAINIKKTKDSIIIDVVYEARAPIVPNIGIVVAFSHHLEISQ